MPGRRAAYAYVAPFFVVFAAFSVYPWIDTAWISLHNVSLSTYDKQDWVGLDNYRNLFTNEFFWNAFRNTITIGIISTVPQLCLALGIAHLLNYRLRGKTFFRVAMLMPYATSLAAATVIFIELFGYDYGFINWALHSVGLPRIDWQNSKWPAQIAVSIIVTKPSIAQVPMSPTPGNAVAGSASHGRVTACRPIAERTWLTSPWRE